MKTMPPGLLRMFVINDRDVQPLTTNLIEPVPMEDGKRKGQRTKRMEQWLQHVYLLGSQPEPLTFDLMFIDIKFEKDQWAPKYGDATVNPFGLLHALTFAARQDPFQAPFVWGYHSGDPGSVKNDPVAIIVFSLLSALERRGEAEDIMVQGGPWKWDDVGLHKSPRYAIEHFSSALECLPQGGPEVIFADMIRRYRNKLLLHVLEERCVVDPDELEATLQLAGSGTEPDRQKLATAGITISNRLGPRWVRKLLLQSLFADELVDRWKIWPEGKSVKSLYEYLQELKVAGLVETREFWISRVDEIMARIKREEPTVLNGIRPKKLKKRIGALAIMCWWLQEKALEKETRESNVKPFNTNDLLRDFGYSGEHRDPVEGCLAAFGHQRLAAFFDYLETAEEPVPPPYHEIGRYWWKNRCEGRDDDMPQWLR